MDTETAPAGSSQLLNTIFLNDRGLRAGWRLLIYLALVVGLLACLQFGLMALTSRLHLPSPAKGVLTPGAQTVAEIFGFLMILLASFIMARIERRNVAEYGLPLHHVPVARRFFVGYFFWGFLPLSVCLFVIHLFGGFSFGSLVLHGADIARFAVEWGIAFILVGLLEEYLLRGYLLYTLGDGIGFWPAAVVMAVIFGIGHSFNPGENRVGLIATVVFAMFASMTLRCTGNLWLAVGAHAGWDWGQSFFYGVSDSGMQAQGHLLEPAFHGPAWLTGGSVGPEGSAVTLILWSLMIVLFAVIYRRRGPALVVVTETRN
jgi:CAAX protease family protein